MRKGKGSYRDDSAARRVRPTRESRIELAKSGREKGNRYQKKKSEPLFKGFSLLISDKIICILKWSGVFVGSLLGFLLIGICLLHGYNLVTHSEFFRLRAVDIKGNSKLESREILEIADMKAGNNVLSMSASGVRSAIDSSPWVQTSSVRRVLPDKFEIEIIEKEPGYWINVDGVLRYADKTGRQIAPVTAGRFSSLPTLEVENGAEYLQDRLPDMMSDLERSGLPWKTSSLIWVTLSASRELGFGPGDKLSIFIGIDEWDKNLRHAVLAVNDLARRNELGVVSEVRAYGGNVWVTTTKRAGKRS